MEGKVATTCFHWSQNFIPHCPSSPQTLASTVLSPSSSKRRNYADGGSLLWRCVHRLEQSSLFGSSSTRLNRSRSCEIPKPTNRRIKRTISASMDAFSDEEFSKKIQELALRFQDSVDEDQSAGWRRSASCADSDSVSEFVEPSWQETGHEPPDWPGVDELFPAMIERRANSFDLPVSLRMIKKKLQWQEDIRESGESSHCSVKKAFSSVVFMIRELHSYTLRLREILYFEDLQSILVRVQEETHASFVWLFQQVFSQTPTLMVSILILLANFTVYSMGNNATLASISPPSAVVSVVESHYQHHSKSDSSTIKTFSVSSSSSGKTTSIGGNNGGGGKVRPIAGGVEDDGQFNRSDKNGTILPNNASQVSSFGTTKDSESVSNREEEEARLWNSILEEASKMRQWRDEVLDQDALQNLIAPVTAKIESDDYAEYLRTELLYQTSLTQEPNNPLLLTNFAQFLYVMGQDYDRAEEYFKRAVAVEPPDAEAFHKYATFLWRARNDLWAAEETFLEGISAEPDNSYYAANYAHFLWNTGGEDTCYPLDAPEA